jgi:2-iminobutanoate/2-iminopropanoate deaminase
MKSYHFFVRRFFAVKKNTIATLQAPAAVGPYSQATAADGLIFVSGQLPIDMETGDLVTDDTERAAHACLTNLRSVIIAAGASMDDVMRTTVYLKSMDDFAKVNEVYAQYFPSEPPARACVEVAALPLGARVEIDAIAYAKP